LAGFFVLKNIKDLSRIKKSKTINQQAKKPLPKIIEQQNLNKPTNHEVIGLIPAGGIARRLAPLPCSKELYPIGFRRVDQAGGLRPKVVCHYLLEKMRLSGTSKAYIILRNGKWDIPAYLRDGKMVDMHLAYLMMDLPFGVPYTLDQAYYFVQEAMVTFGFPDIVFQPDDAFVRLLAQQEASSADIVLGLFPADQPNKMDMVELDGHGNITQIVIKPHETDLHYTWIIAAWTPCFSQFMHEYLLAKGKNSKEIEATADVGGEQELYLGDVIQSAIDNRMKIDTVLFSEGNYLDIGTPDDMVKAIQYRNSV
jgi:glucose-1-phosphate thymidylyltransferase